MIEICDISKTFKTSQGTVSALDQVNFTVERGEIFGIIGQSGAGKSTLIRCLNLLERPTSGDISIDGADITSLKGSALRKLRSSIGMIFQDFCLFQQKNVLNNVLFSSSLKASTPLGRAEARARAEELLELVGLADKAQLFPSQLSGGQKQRVAIARALMNRPSILLCDEATSALDTLTTQSVLELLKKINRELGVTIVLITHSLTVARRVCDRVAVMEQGRIVEIGQTAEVLDHPQSDVARNLVSFEIGDGSCLS